MSFSEGQRVKFRRSHDKATVLTGTIVKMHDDCDLVDIATEPDGKILEVETIETTHTADLIPLEEVSPQEVETETIETIETAETADATPLEDVSPQRRSRGRSSHL
jgi:hypothetical protein